MILLRVFCGFCGSGVSFCCILKFPGHTGFMLFLVSAPLKLSQVGVPWGSVYNGYI